MNREESEKLCLLLLQINAQMDQSTAFVRDKGSEGEFQEYRSKVGQIMGRVVDILESIYEKHPSLRPEQVGGAYKVDPSVFECSFYNHE